jgi:type II secretory pathway component PulJ
MSNRRALLAGMTLIEVIVGLAIASLMTITGWRAIDGLQSARDQTVTDAARWQGLDTFFAALEADLRRADLSSFSGSASALTLLIQNDTEAGAPITVRYGVSVTPDNNRLTLIREAASGSLTFAEVRGAAFEYRRQPQPPAAGANPATTPPDTFDNAITDYPRAVQITVAIVDNNSSSADAPVRSVKRLMVLR